MRVERKYIQTHSTNNNAHKGDTIINMRTKSHDPSTIKTTVIRLRVTEAEAELFKVKAREAGCKTVSEYIGERCINETAVGSDAARQK